MQGNKRKIIIGFVIITLAIQICYLMTSYKQTKEQVNSNREQIKIAQSQIEELEERIKIKQEQERELKKLELQKTAIEYKIPSKGSRAKIESDLLEYISLMDCLDAYISSGSTEILSSTIGNIHQIHYELQFISTYESSRDFIENLTKGYQLCNIQSYNFDASIQKATEEDEQKYRAHFKEQYNSIGRSSVQFNLYYRSTEAIEDEIYQAGLTGKINPTPFKNTVSLIAKNESVDEDKEQDATLKPDFLLNIGDALTLGDTYKLSGPGSTTENYIGLNTTAPIIIKLEVNKQGYQLYMKDSEGHTKETSVEYPLNTPSFRVISNRTASSNKVPRVDIYITNQMDEPIKVFLLGSLVEDIHIYNEQEQEVLKGETKGKVSLME